MADVSEFSLSGRVAVVTGGSTGIGHGIALGMAKAGANVVLAARSAGALDAAREEVAAYGNGVLAVAADVTRREDVQRLVANAIDAFGQVDILVNNAGATFGATFRRAPLLDLTDRDIDDNLALNFRSMLVCAQAFVPHMIGRGSGAIINISSIAGRDHDHPTAGFGVYPAAKAAIISLTKCMAVEWAPQVRVNCIAPGVIDTPRVSAARQADRLSSQLATIAMGRIGLPSDVAGAAVFLASDAASWITGSILDVHGGIKSSWVPVRPAGGPG